jgi:hypothetical protein
MNEELIACPGGKCPLKDKCRRFKTAEEKTNDTSSAFIEAPSEDNGGCFFYVERKN